METKKESGQKTGKNDKKEKCIIFALAGILLLIVCLPVKQKSTEGKMSQASEGTVDREGENINNSSYLKDVYINGGAEEGKQEHMAANEKKGGEGDAYVEAMEKKLEELLMCMEGAGKVRVMITLCSTSEDVVEKDRPANRSNITENDGEGGSRSTSDMDSEEATVFITDSQGRQIPYVRKTLRPVVEGVAVLAEGGGREEVKQNISETIQALFGIDVNKIKIAKMKTGK